MKNIKKLIPMLLACLFAFSACVSPSTPNNSSSSTGGNLDSSTEDSSVEVAVPETDPEIEGIWKDNQNVVINDGEFTTGAVGVQKADDEHFQYANTLHKVNVKESDRAFVVNNKSEYKVLVPFDNDPTIMTAANFLVKYLAQATGYVLPIEANESYTWSENAKWIVLGRTELFKEAGLTMPADELGVSGYYIKSVGDSVFAEVDNAYAWQRVALSLLDHIVGYEMYWNDTVVFEKTGETLPDMDIIERPDFDLYQESNQIAGDGKYGMGFNNNIWIATDGLSTYHNTFKYLPKATYQSAHPKWYSTNDSGGGAGTQLCYTAHGDEAELQAMVKAMADRVYYHASLNTTLTEITITHEDNGSWCGCTSCNEAFEYYNRSNAGPLVKFMNAVDDIVQARLQADADAAGTKKRVLKLVFFGYRKTERPPTIKNEDGTYSPVDDDVICNPNVGVYIATITSDYDTTFYSKENESARENIKGWAAICETIYMWIYDTNFNHYFFPNNTWDSKIETYRFLKENNAYYMHSQSQYNQGAVTHFSRFKDYIDAKASFDVNVNYNDLADAFFTHYYGPAAAPMRQFFDQLQSYMEYLSVIQPAIVVGGYKEKIGQSHLWPKRTLDGYMDLVKQAYACVETIKDSNPAMYEVYKEHVTLESIFPRWGLLSFYSGTFNSEQFHEEASSFRKDCMALGITRSSEGVTLDSTWLDWGV